MARMRLGDDMLSEEWTITRADAIWSGYTDLSLGSFSDWSRVDGSTPSAPTVS
jgi:hypothetical protein